MADDPKQPYSAEDIAEVLDHPKWTRAEISTAKRFDEVLPELAESYRRSRGPQHALTKVPVSIRLSREVVDHFKAGGPGWQTRIDDALAKVVARARRK
jgi:uncharacterized protein (DUF4415 family)